MPTQDQAIKVRYDKIISQTSKDYLILVDNKEFRLPISQVKFGDAFCGRYLIIPWWLVKQAGLLEAIIDFSEKERRKMTKERNKLEEYEITL